MIDWKLSARLSVDPRRRRVPRPRGLRRRGAARGLRRRPLARRCRSTPTTCRGSPSRPRCGASGRRSRRRRCRSSGSRATSTRRRARRWLPPRSPPRLRRGRRPAETPPGSTARAAGIDAAFEHLVLTPPLAAGRNVRLRLLGLPRRAPAARPGSARSAAAGTSCPSSSRIPSGSRASRSSTGSSSRSPIPATGRLLHDAVSRREALRRRDANEARLAALLEEFHSLGLDCVVIGDSSRESIQQAFNDWAEAAHRQPPG